MQPWWGIRCLNVKRTDVDLKWIWDVMSYEIVPFSLRGMSWSVLLRHTCNRFGTTAHQSELENRHLCEIFQRADCCAVFGGTVENSPEKGFETRCQTWFKHLSGENLDCSFDPKHEHPKYSLNYGVRLWPRPACVCGALVETSFILLTAHVFAAKSFHVCTCSDVCVFVYLFPICG